MVDENFSIRYRIEVKKIRRDGIEEVIGDTSFIPTISRTQAKTLLELIDIDMDRANWFEEFKNKIDGGK